MRPISQNKHAIPTQQLAIALKQRTLSLLANWLRSSCYYAMFSLAKKNDFNRKTNQDKAAKYAFKCLDISHRVCDAIKIIYT